MSVSAQAECARLPNSVGPSFLKRRSAGNDLDDLSGDGRLSYAIHVERE